MLNTIDVKYICKTHKCAFNKNQPHLCEYVDIKDSLKVCKCELAQILRLKREFYTKRKNKFN